MPFTDLSNLSMKPQSFYQSAEKTVSFANHFKYCPMGKIRDICIMSAVKQQLIFNKPAAPSFDVVNHPDPLVVHFNFIWNRQNIRQKTSAKRHAAAHVPIF